MNDVGKTNMLQAIRTLFDRKVRSKGFISSDYHKNNTSEPIQIIVEFDISDREENSEQGNDSKILISKISGARNNPEHPNSFIIKLEGIYNEKDFFGNPILYWGSTCEDLELVPNRGQTFAIDKIFHVEYVTPTLNLESTFRKNKRQLFNEETKSDHDLSVEEEIGNNIRDLNSNIGELDSIKEVQKELTSVYKEFRNEQMDIELQSEVSINGYLNNLTPYIKWSDDSNYYPTGGDGRKKLLSYALTKIITEKMSNLQVVIYLIEEPENSLHRSMQMAFSHQLFNHQVYKYFFLTTHSSEILYEMDDTQLVRISNLGNSIGESSYHSVPEEYKNLKKKLNKDLSQAIFYNAVLLVEGSSEFYLFESVLGAVYPEMEIDGKFILQVDGVNFSPYTKLFNELNITYFVKTDNDLQKIKGTTNEFMLTGFNRSLEITGSTSKANIFIEFSEGMSKSYKEQIIKDRKKQIYCTFSGDVNYLSSQNVFLSEIDLENDLFNIIPQELKDITGKENPINWLQSRKLYNMVDFIEHMNEPLAEKIIQGIEVLKEFIKIG